MSRIQLTRATDNDFRVIKNLVRYYIYDMSEYMGWDCNSEGRWDGCDELPDYWEKSGHHPHIIKVGQSTAGFALIRRCPVETERYEVGEFFVARKFQGRGFGKRSAFRMFDLYPGKWLVRVLDANTGAIGFWGKIIRERTNGDFVQSAEQYESPDSGTWPMRFYRFECEGREEPGRA
jgi:predicted acetyltransferase